MIGLNILGPFQPEIKKFSMDGKKFRGEFLKVLRDLSKTELKSETQAFFQSSAAQSLFYTTSKSNHTLG